MSTEFSRKIELSPAASFNQDLVDYLAVKKTTDVG
jgi:hypothetical protein